MSVWNLGKDTKYISHGERVRAIKLSPTNGAYTRVDVYARANTIRNKLKDDHPGQYAISVAVRDRNAVGGWRSGKFTNASDPGIYIWTPELYDKEFNQYTGDPDHLELAAEEIRVYIKRIRKGKRKV